MVVFNIKSGLTVYLDLHNYKMYYLRFNPLIQSSLLNEFSYLSSSVIFSISLDYDSFLQKAYYYKMGK